MSERKKPFKFSMIGLREGDKVQFMPLGIEVPISGPNTIEYNGKNWTLSAFTKTFIPRRSASGEYAGPKYFSYQGRALHDIRIEQEKIQEQEEDW